MHMTSAVLAVAAGLGLAAGDAEDLLKMASEALARGQSDVALSLAGRNASAHEAILKLTPSVDTALGTIRYPVPVTLTISAPGAR